MDAARAQTLPLSHVRPAGIDATIGAGIVVAMPHASCGLAETTRVVRWLADESAGQCGPCVHGLPALADALGVLTYPPSAADAGAALDQLLRWCSQIDGRGACHHPDGAVRLVRSALTAFAPDVDVHLRGAPCPHVERDAVLPVPAAPPGRRRP